MNEQYTTLDGLQRLIAENVEERFDLEYKSSQAFEKNDKKKSEITKDVSAMANSAGGFIIYGIKEFNEKDQRHRPECLDPIDRTQFSKEWLDQVIGSIQPKITDIRIHAVTVSQESNKVIYVIEIPQGKTAHQANDKKYYRRYECRCEAMDDYMIRDVMRRSDHPRIELQFTMNRADDRKVIHENDGMWFDTINVFGHNIGRVVANHVFCEVRLFSCMIHNHASSNKNYTDNGPDRGRRIDFSGRNIGDDGFLHYGASNDVVITSRQRTPIIPGRSFQLCSIYVTKRQTWYEALKDANITWTVWADNSGPIDGKTAVADFYYSGM